MKLKEGMKVKGKRGHSILIKNKIGEGGFGSVYYAEYDGGQGCVVKEANIWDHTGGYSRYKDIIEKKLNIESEILDRVGKHPQIPTLIDFDHERTPPYIATSFIHGKTFYERMQVGQNKYSPLTEAQAKTYILKLMDVIEYLHGLSNPVVHRDIKPANIITHGNSLSLIDFGSCVAEWEGLDISGKTRIFTIGYGAPEQERGRSAVDIRTDVYSIGTTLFFLLTGKDLRYNEECFYEPYDLRPPSKFNSSISKDMSDVVLRAVEIFPEDRFQSVSEMRSAILGEKEVGPKKTTLQLGGVGHTVNLRPGQFMVVGREKGRNGAKEDKDLSISSDYVSDTHIRIERDRHGYWVKDMYSKNGTAVYLHEDGIWKALERGQRWKLYNGDKISLGYDDKRGPCIELLFRDPK